VRCSPVCARLAAHFTRERAARKIVPIVPYLQSHARRCKQRRSTVLRVDRTAYFRERFHGRESRASTASSPRCLSKRPRFPCSDSCVTRVRQRDARLGTGRAEKRGVGMKEIKKENSPERKREREMYIYMYIKRATITTTDSPSHARSRVCVSKVATTLGRPVQIYIYIYIYLYV